MNELTRLDEFGRYLDEPVDPVARQRQRASLTRATETTAPARAAWHRGTAVRRIAAATAASGVVAAGTLLTTVATDSKSDPAYAAEKLPNGTIKITIREFRDAPGLERRLRKLGVRSVVTYLPAGTRCVRTPEWGKRLTGQRRPVFDLVNVLDKNRVPVDYKEAIVHPDRIPPGYTVYIEVVYTRTQGGDRGIWKGEVIGAQSALVSGPAERCRLTPAPPLKTHIPG